MEKDLNARNWVQELCREKMEDTLVGLLIVLDNGRK